MSKNITRITATEPSRSVVFLGLLLFLRGMAQVLLYRDGFLRVSADEFSRGIAAARWASQPKFNLFAAPPGAWLPFQKYLNGLVLAVWPDVIVAPRVTVFLSSCLAIIALYVLVYYLFDSFPVAALASLFVAFQPWIVWLSGTPMLEMYYLAFYLAGLYFLLAWLRDDRRGFWLLAGLSFLVTSGFHVQSWYLINLVNLLTIGFLVRFTRDKQYGRLSRLVVYYFLSNALIFAFLVTEWIHTGEILAILDRHTNYSRWFYGGYDVPVLEKLAFYPRLIWDNTSLAVWLLLATALLFLSRDRDRLWKSFPLVLAISSLVLTAVSNVASGPPSAAPGRYSVFYVLMLAPYVAYGTIRAVQYGKQRPAPLARYLAMLLPLALFVYSLAWGALRAADHPGGPWDAVEAGRQLNQLLDETGPFDRGAYMVELTYWDFLAVRLTAGHYEEMVLDREGDRQDREIPSIFTQTPADFYDILAELNVRYVALTDPQLKATVESADFMSIDSIVGEWTIYSFEP